MNKKELADLKYEMKFMNKELKKLRIKTMKITKMLSLQQKIYKKVIIFLKNKSPLKIKKL